MGAWHATCGGGGRPARDRGHDNPTPPRFGRHRLLPPAGGRGPRAALPNKSGSSQDAGHGSPPPLRVLRGVRRGKGTYAVCARGVLGIAAAADATDLCVGAACAPVDAIAAVATGTALSDSLR